ncbi:MAG TPA: TIGR04282 family arsenosugar biosynthesis glycosyltransferase, partial [Candidatus Saccharimonadales bacterium]|nr:TIGR04282 family arsenosugar biosynthesis glycosyltransferase [Candidatus Saccharimonadales bacterium]
SYEKCVLAVMARAPVPGRAKTRLAARIGRIRAARLYEGFILDTLALVTRLGVPARIFTTGGALRGLRRGAPPGTRWAGQGPGDLGVRMRRAFSACFRGGTRRVVMLGTDSPGLPPRLVRAAFRGLRQADAVVGPALDGGYYLIGMSRPLPELLRGMPWGRPTLLGATARQARRLGIRLGVLPLWFDVDEPADLELLEALDALGRLRPRPRETLRRLREP